VWHGVTTSRLRRVMAPEGTLYAVDPFPVGRLGISFQQRIARAEVGKITNGQVRWVRASGERAARGLAPALGGKGDFVVLDGDHSFEAVRADWEGWRPLVRAGGLVALHDSRSTPERSIDGCGSACFTREVILLDPTWEFVEAVDSVTVVR